MCLKKYFFHVLEYDLEDIMGKKKPLTIAEKKKVYKYRKLTKCVRKSLKYFQRTKGRLE